MRAFMALFAGRRGGDKAQRLLATLPAASLAPAALTFQAPLLPSFVVRLRLSLTRRDAGARLHVVALNARNMHADEVGLSDKLQAAEEAVRLVFLRSGCTSRKKATTKERLVVFTRLNASTRTSPHSGPGAIPHAGEGDYDVTMT